MCCSWLVCAILRHTECQTLASEVSPSICKFPGKILMKMYRRVSITPMFSLQPYNQDIFWHLGSAAGGLGRWWWWRRRGQRESKAEASRSHGGCAGGCGMHSPCPLATTKTSQMMWITGVAGSGGNRVQRPVTFSGHADPCGMFVSRGGVIVQWRRPDPDPESLG